MAGLVPAIHVFLGGSRVQVFVQVPPVGVRGMDEANFPSARPVLDVALALDRVAEVFVELGQHKSLEAISACESVDQAFAMLERPACDVARHAGVKRAARLVRHDVDPAAAHQGERYRCSRLRQRRGWPEQARP